MERIKSNVELEYMKRKSYFYSNYMRLSLTVVNNYLIDDKVK